MNCNIPDIIELSSFDGDYGKYEEAVYSLFCKDFNNQDLFFRGLKIGHKEHPKYKDKSATFWHIISSGPDEADRSPDLRRYERISWPFYILKQCIDQCDQLLVWENIRHGETRILIFCQNIDYLVVLSKRNNYLVFWTAYPVTYPHTKRKLLKEYNEYMAKAAQK